MANYNDCHATWTFYVLHDCTTCKLNEWSIRFTEILLDYSPRLPVTVLGEASFPLFPYQAVAGALPFP